MKHESLFDLYGKSPLVNYFLVKENVNIVKISEQTINHSHMENLVLEDNLLRNYLFRKIKTKNEIKFDK